MDIQQVKQIDLKKLILSMGIPATKDNLSDTWFKSPLRNESTPSFKVNCQKNCWYDYGNGKGGNTLDFLMEYWGCSASETLSRLNKEGNTFFFHQPSSHPVESKGSEIYAKRVTQLNNTALLKYITNRRVSPGIAKQYLSEVYYNLGMKALFSVGLPNLSGGYEMRNAYMKNCIGKKDISHIPHKHSSSVAIFEGMMDFLSALSFFGRSEHKTHVIILNSVSLIDRAVVLIKEKDFKEVLLFLDNDAAGRKGAHQFNKDLSCKVQNCSRLYADYKDFNEMWMEGGD